MMCNVLFFAIVFVEKYHVFILYFFPTISFLFEARNEMKGKLLCGCSGATWRLPIIVNTAIS